MKHRINASTGICVKCGLSSDPSQRTTKDCFGSLLPVNTIKGIAAGKWDYTEELGWFNPNDFMKLHPTPKPASHDVDNSGSMNYSSKPTYEIVSADELPLEVHEMITQLMDDLGFTQLSDAADANLTKARVTEIFGEAFKVREVNIKTESPDFSDDELELLQQIKDNPIPVSYVLSFGLSKPNMDRLRTLHKYGAVTIHDGAYHVTAYGDSFLTEPEKETEPVLTVGDVGLLMFISHEGTMITSMISDMDALDELNNLRRKSMVYQTLSGYQLTQKGVNYVNKVLALPLI